MSTDVKLLPLPELHLRYGHFGEDALAYATDYARANMEPLLAENERLRGEVGKRNGIDPWAVLIRAQEAEARSERLAEALRDLLEIGDKFTGDPDEDAATYCDVTDKARAALDQEGGNG